MVLSGEQIKEEGIFSPHSPRTVFEGMSYGQSYAGYDIRIAQSIRLGRDLRFKIASTMEEFNTPPTVIGVVHDKSSLARKGLSVFNTVIEPGWRGFLTLELVYHGDGILNIIAGSPIAQVIFHRIERPSGVYEGKYQNQPNCPVEALHE